MLFHGAMLEAQRKSKEKAVALTFVKK